MEEKKVGLSIIIRDCITSETKNKYFKVVPEKSLEYTILDCLTKKYEIQVAAVSLYDAIDKILYALNALSGDKRQFFLSQIAMHLKEVSIWNKELCFMVDDDLKNLIRDNKLYRIHAYESEVWGF